MSRTRLVAAVLAAVALAGCSGAPSATPADSGSAEASTDSGAARDPATGQRQVPVIVSEPAPDLPVTVTDAGGRTVTVTDVSRIVSLSGGITEVLVALGLGDEIVGRDISSELPGAQDIPLVSNAHDVSAEGVLSLRPTLVLADTNTGPPEALDAIRSSGVPLVVVPEVWSLAEAASRNDAVAAAVGLADDGVLLTDYVRAHANGVRLADSPVVAFLYLRGQAAVYLMGGNGSGADSLLEAIGAQDAGTTLDLGPFTPLTPEALVAAQPDALLLMTEGLESVGGVDGLLELPGIAQTPAGRNRRVVTIPDGELLSFGPRTAQTLADIASQLSRTAASPAA